jgi:hypothetical protein
VRDLLPDHKRARVIKDVEVEQGDGCEQRCGGEIGPFVELNHVVQLQIFAAVPLRERLSLALAVCRSFRRLLSVPSLWARLGNTVSNTRCSDYDAGLLQCKGPALLRLAKLLPEGCVTNLQMKWINTPSDVKDFFPIVGPLKTLALVGKKVTKTMLVCGAKNGGFAELRQLSIGGTASKLTLVHVFDSVIARAPRLEKLTLKSFTWSRAHVAALVSASKKARSGGATLLRSLDAGGYTTMPLSLIEAVACGIPELEHFAFNHSDTESLFSPSSRIGFGRVDAIFSLLPLSRLRSLSCSNWNWTPWGMKQSEVDRINTSTSSLIGSVLRSAPLLAKLEHRVRPRYVSKARRRAGVTPKPNPTLSADAIACPPGCDSLQLTSITLDRVTVSYDALCALAAHGKRLEYVSITNCGVDGGTTGGGASAAAAAASALSSSSSFSSASSSSSSSSSSSGGGGAVDPRIAALTWPAGCIVIITK